MEILFGSGSTPPAAPAPTTGVPAGFRAPAESPGRSGPSATREIDPRSLEGVRVAYAPDDDEAPDPGEIVWTWVPYEEADGRGKDRPVVVVAADGRGGFLALQLTSKAHAGEAEYLAIGSGAWDASGRGSWVDLGRVFLVRAEGMRREAAALDAAAYGRIADAVRARYGWA
nr:type II toxin-antitoxin system PemK/MazF family toxin [Agromyces seonyuensis]